MSPHDNLTFDAVQRSGHETTYDEVAHHYDGPMSKHPVISVKGHPEVIWVRPDMGVGMVALSFSRSTRSGEASRFIPSTLVAAPSSPWEPCLYLPIREHLR